ncbi:hypothetical protein HPB50_015689 [Hyalomma asiaticum]|uniref:Uncharacterized protein n=1 Tax=Hyalomma asiaticum TaxID=266040 RepID=A0ACB7SV14_HYAAI|nr:hypothetical protein HPB50_015689 [Hyalomma asiaticum]
MSGAWRFERVTAPLPFLPDDRFPGSKTLTGLLTHGNPKSVLMSRLRDSVDDWTPFMLEDMDECAERTRRRHAVFIDGSLYQERYAYSLRGQVEVSSQSLQDFVPMCYVLPKASPYEDLIQNAIMRMFEAGLFNQFELRYRYRNLSSPKNFSNEDVGRVLQIENTALPFCCLAVGLAIALMAFAGETRSRIAIGRSSRWPMADVNFKHTVINEPRAFATEFLLPIRYEKFAYMYPSPRVIVSRFAVLRVFSFQNPFSPKIKQLHDSVPDWSAFLADSMEECVLRTVRRQAVMFSSLQNLERYAYSHRGYVQISREYIHDFTPMGYVLPKASPYKEVLQNVQVQLRSLPVMRMFEAGLFDQFERFERYEHLPHPKSHPEISHEQVLHLRKSLLPFCCLGVGLTCAIISISCEILAAKFRKREQAKYFVRRREMPSRNIPVKVFRRRILPRNCRTTRNVRVTVVRRHV